LINLIDMRKLKIAVIGTGGVGGYFGGKLAKAGHDVVFLARGEHYKALLNSGLRVSSIGGDFVVAPVSVVNQIDLIGPVDLVIVAIKAWQIQEVSPMLKSLLHSQTMVLPLQNGVMASSELSVVLGDSHVLGGLCRIISKIESAGVINHFGVEPMIVFGEIGAKVSDRCSELQAIFNDAGFKGRAVDDIEAELWKKFIAICVSGLLAISRSSYGEIRTCAQSRQLMIDLFREIYELSQIIGIAIGSDYVDKAVANIDTFPFDTTSSLARDVWAGKPSEIEYQNGTVVKLAQQYGCDVPVNRVVYSAIVPMELRARANYS
jgi:2-dehydropantoate 2-reductase